MTMKLCMENYELKLYTIYINGDSELTLTYFTTMSNLSKFVFVLILGTDNRWAFTGPLFLWLCNLWSYHLRFVTATLNVKEKKLFLYSVQCHK